MKKIVQYCCLLMLIISCGGDNNKVYYEFEAFNSKDWKWEDSKNFTFEIKESGYYYSINTLLRINSNYKFSNIWIIAELEKKTEFEIPISDFTGKWLGKGSSNLIMYEKTIFNGLQLKPGKYTLKLYQNTRAENLEGVNDIGIEVKKGKKII